VPKETGWRGEEVEHVNLFAAPAGWFFDLSSCGQLPTNMSLKV